MSSPAQDVKDVKIRDQNFATEENEASFSLAMEQSHFCAHNLIVLLLCGLAVTSISGPGSSLLQTRYIVACNLTIDYDQQMQINACTFVALISGGLLIAVPSDLASRLKPLIVSLIFYGLATLSLGFCTEYYCLASLSVFRAFWAAALLPVITVYVAELQNPRYRGLGLCCLQIFWLIGVAAMPVLSNAWRASQFIFGTLALGLSIPIGCFLTESPRLLLSLGKNEAAIEIIRKIYSRNSRNPQAEYSGKTGADDNVASGKQNYNNLLRTYVPKALHPPWYCLIIVLQIEFIFNLCYFTMSYWFRRINCRHVLLFRVKQRDANCGLGERYLPVKLIDVDEKNGTSSCDSSEAIEAANYYKEVLILVFSTLPILIWMILRIDQSGRSCFITLSHAIAGLLSFCVHFIIATKHDMLYTCLMESMLVVSATASSCLVTEIFRTKFRVLGVALANSLGYVGMAMGIYGVFIKEGANCIFLISLTGILLTDINE